MTNAVSVNLTKLYQAQQGANNLETRKVQEQQLHKKVEESTTVTISSQAQQAHKNSEEQRVTETKQVQKNNESHKLELDKSTKKAISQYTAISNM